MRVVNNPKDGLAVGTGHDKYFHSLNTSVLSGRGRHFDFATRTFHLKISWLILSGPVDKGKLIYKACDGTSHEWANPVYPMIGPFACD